VKIDKLLWVKNCKPNQWVCFRKEIDLETVPDSAILDIAVDTKYWLYINGEIAVFDGGLNRESLPGCGYYDRVDISKFLLAGKNIISFLVWYWGNDGRNNVDSGQAGLFVKCSELNFTSDKTFKIKQHPAFIETGEPLPSYLYGGHNTGFNAELDIGQWMLPNYDDSSWECPEEIEAGRWGEMYERPIPDFIFTDYKDYSRIAGNSNRYFCQLPYAAHITPYFKINARKGQTVDIRTDRYSVNGGPGEEERTYNCHRTYYIAKDGVQEFESLDWLFGEQVIYEFSESVEIINLKYRETGYHTHFAGDFKCENIMINTLVEKCKRTLYVCMRDNFMDCPDRERGQWIGDVSTQIPQAFYCLDRNADLLCKKTIHDFINLRKDKVLVGNVPGTSFCELPSQSLNAISDIGLIKNYALYSGDLSVFKFAYPAIRNYLLLWDIKEDGHLSERKGYWYWFDHLENVDEKLLETCWYYSALKFAIKLAEFTDNYQDVEKFKERCHSIENNFDYTFRKKDGYRSKLVCDDRANALCVLSGLATSDMTENIFKVFDSNYFSTPYMEYYVLEAMFKLGKSRQAMERILKRYTPLIENENSTLWEDFDRLGTKNHAWSGGPLTILFKYAAGILPLKPGYESVSIMPENTGLQKISAKTLTVKGEIKVEISKSDTKYIMNITTPELSNIKLGIPKDIFEDNKSIRFSYNNISIRPELQDNHFVITCNGKLHQYIGEIN